METGDREAPVRRLREESLRRAEEQRRAFSSWCALASLAGGVCVAVLDLHLQENRVEVSAVSAAAGAPSDPAAAHERAHLEECFRTAAVARQVNVLLDARLAAARNERERASIRAELEPRLAQLLREWAVRSCPAMPPQARREKARAKPHACCCAGPPRPGS